MVRFFTFIALFPFIGFGKTLPIFSALIVLIGFVIDSYKLNNETGDMA
jgi:hypothetical protein